MRKVALLTAAMLLSLAGTAQASTVDILLGSTDGSVSYGTGGTLNPNVDLTSIPGLVWTGGNAILPSGFSIQELFLSPTGVLYQNKYLAVMGGGTSTFNLASNGNTFGFTWGSIDSYNTLVIKDSRNFTYTITGTDLSGLLTGFEAGKTQADVIIKDPFAQIVSVELISSANSFEVGNFQRSVRTAVPLPAAAPLFGIALAGLAFVGLRRRKAI